MMVGTRTTMGEGGAARGTLSRFVAGAVSTTPTMTALFFLLMVSFFSGVQGQSIPNLCTGELGEVGWDCETLAPVPGQVFGGQEDLLPLPGSPDPSNPVLYKQISGGLVTFDPATGERSADSGDGAAVFALTEGSYWCMLAESDGEAALFDAPEGSFVSSSDEYPTGTWLSESIASLLAPGTKLKYIVYTHAHWDHIGTAGFVYDYFAEDEPTIIASKRIRADLKTKDDRDPSSPFGNTRGVPIPDKLEEDEYRELRVGGLLFDVQKIHGHERGDFFVFLDKNVPQNAAEGINTSIFMIVDVIFPGWAPFWSAAIASDVGDYYDAMDEILTYDFDLLVAGHLTRTGTKADVQLQKYFFDDVLEGVKLGLATVPASEVAAGTGVFDPTNPNAGNSWLFFNELFERQTDVCEAYVLDSVARGRDWLTELAGVDLTLRSQCWVVSTTVRVG